MSVKEKAKAGSARTRVESILSQLGRGEEITPDDRRFLSANARKVRRLRGDDSWCRMLMRAAGWTRLSSR